MKIHDHATGKNKVITKIRGFSILLTDVNRKITFNSMKSLLLNDLLHNKTGCIETEDEHKIRRQKLKRKLVTVHEKRKYAFNYIKQYVIADNLTVQPYGY